jgi:predicted carbohydrate-binding protein with CBM5 and CBM33 domain
MELPTSHAWQPGQPLSRHQMNLAFKPLHSRGLVAEKAHNTVSLVFKIPCLKHGAQISGLPFEIGRWPVRSAGNEFAEAPVWSKYPAHVETAG